MRLLAWQDNYSFLFPLISKTVTVTLPTCSVNNLLLYLPTDGTCTDLLSSLQTSKGAMHTMKTYWWGGICIAPLILNPGTTLMEASSQLHTLEKTLVSTKHQAVQGPRAGQVVFGKEKLYSSSSETLLLTFNSQEDYNWVTAICWEIFL